MLDRAPFGHVRYPTGNALRPGPGYSVRRVRPGRHRDLALLPEAGVSAAYAAASDAAPLLGANFKRARVSARLGDVLSQSTWPGRPQALRGRGPVGADLPLPAWSVEDALLPAASRPGPGCWRLPVASAGPAGWGCRCSPWAAVLAPSDRSKLGQGGRAADLPGAVRDRLDRRHLPSPQPRGAGGGAGTRPESAVRCEAIEAAAPREAMIPGGAPDELKGSRLVRRGHPRRVAEALSGAMVPRAAVVMAGSSERDRGGGPPAQPAPARKTGASDAVLPRWRGRRHRHLNRPAVMNAMDGAAVGCGRRRRWQMPPAPWCCGRRPAPLSAATWADEGQPERMPAGRRASGAITQYGLSPCCAARPPVLASARAGLIGCWRLRPGHRRGGHALFVAYT